MKILIIEDNPVNIIYLESLLKKQQIEIESAVNGKLGLKKAVNFKPDIILLDVIMPGIDGYEVCKHLKKNQLTKNIPVIITTALSDVKSFKKAYDAGASDFLNKPLKEHEILLRINVHFQNYKLLEQLKEANIQYEAQVEELKQITQNLDETTKDLTKNYQLYQHSADAIFTLRNNIILDCNDALLKLFKFQDKEDFIGRHQASYSPEYQPDGSLSYNKIEEYIQQALDKKNVCFEWLQIDTLGKPFFVEITLTALVFDGDQYGLGIMRDITKRKEMELTLNQSEKRYRSIIEETSDHVYRTLFKDGKPYKTIHNYTCVALTGYPSIEFEKDPDLWNKLIVPTDREYVNNQINNALQRQETTKFKYQITYRNGDIHKIKNTIVLLKDDNGNIVEYNCIIHKINE